MNYEPAVPDVLMPYKRMYGRRRPEQEELIDALREVDLHEPWRMEIHNASVVFAPKGETIPRIKIHLSSCVVEHESGSRRNPKTTTVKGKNVEGVVAAVTQMLLNTGLN